MDEGSESDRPGPPAPDAVLRTALSAVRAQPASGLRAADLHADPAARVRRLHAPGEYLLVPLRDAAGALRAVVQLDAADLSVESCALPANPGSQFLTSEAQALSTARAALAGKTGWHTPVLAWRPCRESFDSLQPLWLVRHAHGHAYVTQRGEVFEALTVDGRGG